MRRNSSNRFFFLFFEKYYEKSMNLNCFVYKAKKVIILAGKFGSTSPRCGNLLDCRSPASSLIVCLQPITFLSSCTCFPVRRPISLSTRSTCLLLPSFRPEPASPPLEMPRVYLLYSCFLFQRCNSPTNLTTSKRANAQLLNVFFCLST